MTAVLIVIGLIVVTAFLLMMRRAQSPVVLLLRDPRDTEHYPDPNRPEQCAVCRRIYPCPYRTPQGPVDKVAG